MTRIYPESHIEIQGFQAKHYDFLLKTLTFGKYDQFIKQAISAMNIRPNEHILDLGCGSGSNACLMRQYLQSSGLILGMDISDEMGEQFVRNCNKFPNTFFRKQRIDQPVTFREKFDRVLISFVLHGFPHHIRFTIINNIFTALKPGGVVSLLDFSEFSLKEMPLYYRIPFKTVECKYAFEFIEQDWKMILGSEGFGNFTEKFWLKGYARLLQATKKV